MKRHFFTALVLALGSASGAAADSIVYDNTTTDTLNTVVYSTGPYNQIGDLITLGGVDRTLTGATVQFFNEGDTAGTFDAILRFWNSGAPVGAQIGGDYEVDNIAIDTFMVQNVAFTIPDLSVPDTLIATVQILNATAGTDLGLDLFDPPTVGSSDDNSFIVNDTVFQSASTGSGNDNLYLQLQATTLTATVPEPAPAAMFMGGIFLLAAFVRRPGRR